MTVSVLPQAAAAELLEPLWDPETTRRLSALGIGRGWRCFTSSSPAARLARWLAATVSPRGCVLTRSPVDRPSSPVVRLGVHDPLPPSFLDLAHLRVRAADELQPVPSLIASLKPGRWLVLEALDWATWPGGSHPRMPDPHLGRDLLAQMRGYGLEDVRAVAHAAFAQAEPGLRPPGSPTRPDDQLSPLMVTAWARRPSAHQDSATHRREEGTLAAGEPMRRKR